MKKKYIYIFVGLVIAYFMSNHFLYFVSSFGTFEVINKQKTGDKFELVVELEDEGKNQAIEINDKTQIIYKERDYAFTEDIWEKITINTEYQMGIQKYRFPVSVFKGEYSLSLLYLD